MRKTYWMQKLTPYDAELCLMVESLTGKPCEPKNGGESYLIEANYEAHKDEPEYLLALWDAIEGRAGKRLISLTDDPERTCFVVQIEFSKEKYPGIVFRQPSFCREKPEEGERFCQQLCEVRALEVTPDNVGRLFEFVGNGDMEIPDDGPCVFTFRNASGSVYATAKEGDYVVYVAPGRFNVVEKQTFEKRYERKNDE